MSKISQKNITQSILGAICVVVVVLLISVLTTDSGAKNNGHAINKSDTSGVLNPMPGAFFWSMDDTLRFSNDISSRVKYADTSSMLSGYMRKGSVPKEDYTNTGAIAGGAGNVIFYLTSDKTASGTALYSNVTYVNPIVNDAAINYTYGWTISGDKKTLTVNVKAATGLYVALLNLTLLGTPANVANGVSVSVLAKGN